MVVATLATLATLAACGRHMPSNDALDVVRDTTDLAEGSAVLGSAPITVGAFQYRGANHGLRSRWPPVITQVTVTVTNVSERPASLHVLGGNCAVLLRIYAHRVPLEPPVFDASGPGVSCYVPVDRYPLTPGQSVTLHSAGGGPGIDLLPGRYDLAAIVTVADSTGSQRIEIPAGSVRVLPLYQ
jgi:hypothetical protein